MQLVRTAVTGVACSTTPTLLKALRDHPLQLCILLIYILTLVFGSVRLTEPEFWITL